MTRLRVDPQQRFTCRRCARCCTNGWRVALTPAELARYRAAGAQRWFRAAAGAPEGVADDPFESAPELPAGYGVIRERRDGVCGFLSPAARCRLHEELGAAHKPLTCRMFPFRFQAVEREVVVCASFSCPTVAAAEGAPLASQGRELRELHGAWARHFATPAHTACFVSRRPIARDALAELRTVLQRMLGRPGPEGGAPDIKANVARMAHTLEDLTRQRVLRLTPDAFAEYLKLTGRFAATSAAALPQPRPSLLARLLLRGFLFALAASRLQTRAHAPGGLTLRLRLLRLAGHLHGLGGPCEGYDLPAARRAQIDFSDPATTVVVRHYLHASIETLGGSRRPVLDELSFAFSVLNAALTLAAMRSTQQGRVVASAESVVTALTEAHDFAHAAAEGWMAPVSGTLSGGLGALTLFASWPGAPAAGQDAGA